MKLSLKRIHPFGLGTCLIAAFFTLLLFLGLSTPTQAEDMHYEAEWVKKFCGEDYDNVKTENGLWVDCVKDGYAYEYDWAKKWAECIGQSLEYGRSTGLTPACVLIVRDPEKDLKHVDHVIANIQRWCLPIELFLVSDFVDDLVDSTPKTTHCENEK